MKLSIHQQAFARDLQLLFEFILHVKGYEITIDWAKRDEETQKRLYDKGLSKTLKSNHLKKLAIDLNIFIDGKLTYDKNKLQEIGEFWENLNKYNRWGGNFKGFVDTPHFERNV